MPMTVRAAQGGARVASQEGDLLRSGEDAGGRGVDGETIRVLMVDDHELMREAYGTLLSEDPGIEVVGLAGDGQEGVALAAKLQPNVVFPVPRLPTITITHGI